MCGLLILKQLENLSDEGLLASWVMNPYFQVFCGETTFHMAHLKNLKNEPGDGLKITSVLSLTFKTLRQRPLFWGALSAPAAVPLAAAYVFLLQTITHRSSPFLYIVEHIVERLVELWPAAPAALWAALVFQGGFAAAAFNALSGRPARLGEAWRGSLKKSSATIIMALCGFIALSALMIAGWVLSLILFSILSEIGFIETDPILSMMGYDDDYYIVLIMLILFPLLWAGGALIMGFCAAAQAVCVIEGLDALAGLDRVLSKISCGPAGRSRLKLSGLWLTTSLIIGAPFLASLGLLTADPFPAAWGGANANYIASAGQFFSAVLIAPLGLAFSGVLNGAVYFEWLKIE